jgi:hypothetical protein
VSSQKAATELCHEPVQLIHIFTVYLHLYFYFDGGGDEATVTVAKAVFSIKRYTPFSI